MVTMERVASIVEDHRANAATGRRRRTGLTETIAKGPMAAALAKRAKARAAYAGIAAPMKELRRHGLTFKAIADTLNAEGHRTRYGSLWDAANVKRVIDCYA